MATTQEMLEQENDQLVDTLKDKVSALRTVSIIYCTVSIIYSTYY